MKRLWWWRSEILTLCEKVSLSLWMSEMKIQTQKGYERGLERMIYWR